MCQRTIVAKTFVFANDEKVSKCLNEILTLIKLLESPPLRFARARRSRDGREKPEGEILQQAENRRNSCGRR